MTARHDAVEPPSVLSADSQKIYKWARQLFPAESAQVAVTEQHPNSVTLLHVVSDTFARLPPNKRHDQTLHKLRKLAGDDDAIGSLIAMLLVTYSEQSRLDAVFLVIREIVPPGGVGRFLTDLNHLHRFQQTLGGDSLKAP